METGIHNTSEIGRLRKVMLHRPGQELENLMPEYLERLLFDDIPYLKEAQAEHDAFAQCLRDAGVEVVYLMDLVVNSLTSPEARQELLTQFLDEAGLPDEAARDAVEEYLSGMNDREMVAAMMAGIRRSDLRKQGSRLSDHLSAVDEDYPFAVDPMPNLYFTRDPFATIGTGVSIHRMHTVTRNRETLFGRFIFEHNPWYKNAPRWYDRSASSSLEGGRYSGAVTPGAGGGNFGTDRGGLHRPAGADGAFPEQDLPKGAGLQHSQEPLLHASGHRVYHGGSGQIHRASQYSQ